MILNIVNQLYILSLFLAFSPCGTHTRGMDTLWSTLQKNETKFITDINHPPPLPTFPSQGEGPLVGK